jgi:hypothetical protein
MSAQQQEAAAVVKQNIVLNRVVTTTAHVLHLPVPQKTINVFGCNSFENFEGGKSSMRRGLAIVRIKFAPHEPGWEPTSKSCQCHLWAVGNNADYVLDVVAVEWVLKKMRKSFAFEGFEH